jgi:hypothetical protein
VLVTGSHWFHWNRSRAMRCLMCKFALL